MHDLTTTTEIRLPAPMTPDLHQAIRTARNGAGQDQRGRLLVAPDRMPTTAIGAALQSRYRLIAGALDQRDRRQIGQAVVDMLATFQRRSTDDEARVVAAAYVAVLSDLPPWAVMQAAMRFARGQVADHHPGFPPSAAELHREADRIVSPWRDERADIAAVLDALPAPPEPTQEERERTIAKLQPVLDALTHSLSMGEELDKRRKAEIESRRQEAYREREERMAGFQGAGAAAA